MSEPVHPFLNHCIVLVDDDERFRTHMGKALERRGLEVHHAGDAQQGLELVREIEPELMLIDLRMPGDSGLMLITKVRELEAIEQPRIVVLTGYGSIATALEAVRRGATHYLQKPANAEEVLLAFRRDELAPEEPLETPESVPSLARAEWEHIDRILTDCNGNIRQAARQLGIHRRTLQRKLAKFPVKR